MSVVIGFTITIFSKMHYSLAGQDEPEQILVRQVQLVPDSLTGRQSGQETHRAPECLCHQDVIPVNVKDLPSPPVNASTRQLLPTSWAEHPHPPQAVGHPYHQPMGEEAVGCWRLMINQSWNRGLVPQLQIWPQFAGVKEGVGNPPLILNGD